MKYKIEYAVRRANKIWRKCATKREAIKIAKINNNTMLDTDISPFTAEFREVSDWSSLK